MVRKSIFRPQPDGCRPLSLFELSSRFGDRPGAGDARCGGERGAWGRRLGLERRGLAGGRGAHGHAAAARRAWGRCAVGARGAGDRDAGGAQVLGRSDCGALEPGKRADIAVWDMTGIEAAGAWDPVAALLLCGPARVRHLYVEGRQVCATAISRRSTCRVWPSVSAFWRSGSLPDFLSTSILGGAGADGPPRAATATVRLGPRPPPRPRGSRGRRPS